MNRNNEYVTISYDKIVREPDERVGMSIILDIDGEDIVIPTSQVRDHDRDANEIEIPQWLAEDRGVEWAAV